MCRHSRSSSVLLTLAFLILTPFPSNSQTTGSDPTRSDVFRQRVYTITVRDNSGTPLSNAVALLGEGWAERADAQGVIRLDSRTTMRFPIMIEVQAPGFQPRQVMIDGFQRGGTTDIYLERSEAAPPRGGGTVSASELTKENREAAQKLEEAAIRALEKGENEKAEAVLRQAIDVSPSSSGAYNNLGVATLRQGRLEEAARYFEKGFHLTPYNAVAAGNLGLVRWLQGRREDCYELLDRAIALGFTSPLAHYYLGVLALERGHYKQSAQELQNVDGRRFRYRDLYLSVAQRGLGQLKTAWKTFQDFCQHNPVQLFGFAWRPTPTLAADNAETAASAAAISSQAMTANRK